MKKILIIGATGGLAQHVIEAAQQTPELELTLFARQPNRIPSRLSEGATLIEGNAMNIADLEAAILGKDLVYVNLAGNLDAMSQNIIAAMKSTGVSRIVAISSIEIYKTPLQSVLVPYRKLADNIEASGLDYTIIRPDWFTSGSEIDYHITRKPEAEVGGAVSQKSIAHFVNEIFDNPELYLRENVGISRL